MKIAMVHTPLWGRGGAERQVLNLAIELQKLGNEVEIFTPIVNEKTCYPELLKQVTVKQLPQNSLIPFRRSSDLPASSTSQAGEIADTRNRLQTIAVHQFYTTGLPSMLRLARIIPKGFDIINNHNANTEWAAFTAKRRLKIPVVWMCNEPPSWYYFAQGRGIRKKLNWPLFEIWDKTSVKYIDEILVLSHVAAGLVKNIYNRQARVVRTGINADKFFNISGDEVRKKNRWENSFVLLQVANYVPFKRQRDSIMALYFLSRSYDNVKLALDGSGPKEGLMRLIEKLGLKDKVLFQHSKCDEELAKAYAACDAFLFPTQMTWGLAVVEAMASSKPVVVSRANGVSEIIQDNVNGMLFEHAKPEEMAKKIEALINNPKLRANIGKNACEYVKANLSWEKYAKNMENVFKSTIANYKRNT